MAIRDLFFSVKLELRRIRRQIANVPYKPLLAAAIGAFVSIFLVLFLSRWLPLREIWIWLFLGQFVVTLLLAGLYGGLVGLRSMDPSQRKKELASGMTLGVLMIAMAAGVTFDEDRALVYVGLFIAVFFLHIYLYRRSLKKRR